MAAAKKCGTWAPGLRADSLRGNAKYWEVSVTRESESYAAPENMLSVIRCRFRGPDPSSRL